MGFVVTVKGFALDDDPGLLGLMLVLQVLESVLVYTRSLLQIRWICGP